MSTRGLCVPTIYVLGKNKKSIKIFLLIFLILTAEKKISDIAWVSFHNATVMKTKFIAGRPYELITLFH